MIFRERLPLLALPARDPANEALDLTRGHCPACQVVNLFVGNCVQTQTAYTRRIVMFAIQISWKISISFI